MSHSIYNSSSYFPGFANQNFSQPRYDIPERITSLDKPRIAIVVPSRTAETTATVPVVSTSVEAEATVAVVKEYSRLEDILKNEDEIEPAIEEVADEDPETIHSDRRETLDDITAIDYTPARMAKLALIIPAYNESLVIAHTINTAVAAGMLKRDIYVVDDSSSDNSAEIAKSILGDQNVLTVGRSGKGLAISKITKAFQLTKRYRWIHIADADGEFDKNYFSELRTNLRVKHAAATGYVTSLPGGYISKYRTFEYAIGMDVIRRFQNVAKVITIIPGPTSIFRNDIFDQLTFGDDALCEDFDVTLQLHRKKLGTIQFIPTAIARTQDPATFKDFIKQITRWNRGVLQMFFKHKIGKKASRVDAYLTYQVMQNLLFFMMYLVWIPIVTFTTDSLLYLSLSFLSDVLLVFGFAMFAASRTKQYQILSAFPLIYALRWVSLYIFMKSFVEVVLLGKFRKASGLWETVARRRQAKV